jgi:hypothetical protein
MSMSRLIAQIFLLGVLATLCPLNSLVGQTDQRPSRVKLSDLGFMMGLWQADWSGGLGEERWSLPSGDSMVGTFRFVKDGKGQFYELMLVEQTTHGPVLRLKHFNAGLVGWEDKTKVYSYPLIECHQGAAIFEREDKKSRLTYRRTSKQTLLVVLDEPRDGKLHSENFEFRLAE